MEENENSQEQGASVVESEAMPEEKLLTKIRKMENEFNAQRAKMKEMYMLKETEYAKAMDERRRLQQELDELKSQFLVADLKSENEMQLKDLKSQEEISSLQQLVQDTIEESTMCKAELDRIKEESGRVCQENKDLREYLQKLQQHQQQQLQQQQQQLQMEATSSGSGGGGGGGLAPQMLNQVKRTIARKLAGDSTPAMGSFQQDSIDEGTRPKGAGNQYAHEDAEVLRSIVEQLQEEMKALKEKLRETDEKLHAKHTNSKSVATANNEANISRTGDPESAMHKSTSTDLAEAACEACTAAESKCDELLSENKKLQTQLDVLRKNLEESYENLQKEAALRKDLEDQWQEKREAHKTEVQQLREQVKTNENQLYDMQQKFLETKEEVTRQLQRVSDDRERVNKQLETLQADNDFLSGRYLATSEGIESQPINLPNTVQELQELMLRQRNELIQARVSSEFEREKGVTSLSEIDLLRKEVDAVNNEYKAYEKKNRAEIKSLQDRLTEHLVKVQGYETTKAQLERKEAELNRQISNFRVENIELKEANEKLIRLNTNDKSKIKQLQDNLTTNEHVQKDFVKLSQTLQISLEKLRHADTEVRWEEDDDVDNCPTCSTFFTVTVRKIHCRHCGHIYCDKCLTKTVPSGPRKRSARVCDICHTLLTPNTAPYFSHEPTQSK